VQSPLSGVSPCNDKDSSHLGNESDTFSPPQGSVQENEVDPEPDEELDGKQEESTSIDNYDRILAESASSFNFPQRIDYFLGGEPITTSDWDSVELAVLCEAGRIVTNNQVATATKCAEMLEELLSQAELLALAELRHWRRCCQCCTGGKVLCIWRRWLHQHHH
jgi:hypothetical protein